MCGPLSPALQRSPFRLAHILVFASGPNSSYIPGASSVKGIDLVGTRSTASLLTDREQPAPQHPPYLDKRRFPIFVVCVSLSRFLSFAYPFLVRFTASCRLRISHSFQRKCIYYHISFPFGAPENVLPKFCYFAVSPSAIRNFPSLLSRDFSNQSVSRSCRPT